MSLYMRWPLRNFYTFHHLVDSYRNTISEWAVGFRYRNFTLKLARGKKSLAREKASAKRGQRNPRFLFLGKDKWEERTQEMGNPRLLSLRNEDVNFTRINRWFIYYEKAIKLLPLFFDKIHQCQNSCFQIVAFSKYMNLTYSLFLPMEKPLPTALV